MKIPLIKPELPTLGQLSERFDEILKNGKVTNFGKYVQEFEKQCSDYLGVGCVSTSSGTQALFFALLALLDGKKGKVVFPSFTFMATAQIVELSSCEMLFVDVDESLNICPKDLERLLSEHDDIVAVIGLHVFGRPAEVDVVDGIVKAYAKKRSRELPLIWDAAHAFGAQFKGQRVGAFGDAECFSFSITKPLVCTEGGLLSSKNLALLEKIRIMRNYGVKSGYNSILPGLNGKMSEFHAIIGLENLKNFESKIKKRKALADQFAKKLAALSGCQFQAPDQVHDAVWKQFNILIPENLATRRNSIIEFLKNQGIETRAYFSPAIHEQDLFKRYHKRPLPVTEKIAARCLTLPFYESMTEKEMDEVVASLKESFRLA